MLGQPLVFPQGGPSARAAEVWLGMSAGAQLKEGSDISSVSKSEPESPGPTATHSVNLRGHCVIELFNWRLMLDLMKCIHISC